MSSLRARLVAAVLVVAAVGLLLLGRDHLRRAALVPARPRRRAGALGAGAVEGALAERGIGDRPRARPRAAAGGPAAPAAARASACPPAPTASCATPNGKVHSAIVFGYGAERDGQARAPGEARRSASRSRSTARNGDDASYRVVATPTRGAAPGSPSWRSRCATSTRRSTACWSSRARDRRRPARCSRAVAWILVRVGLLPLDRIGHTASRIAGGDLSHRVAVDRPAHRGRPRRARAQRDARPPRARVRRAPGERGPPAPVHRRRLARAAHAAGLDPRLRRAVPDGRGARAARRSRRRCAGSRTRRRAWACSSRTC